MQANPLGTNICFEHDPLNPDIFYKLSLRLKYIYVVFNIHIYIYAYGAIYIDMPLVFESSRASRLHFASPRYCLPGALPAEWPWGARLPAGACAQGGALGMGMSKVRGAKSVA